MKPRREKRGGARKGSGRKPDPTPRNTLQITLPASAYATIKATPGGYALAREKLKELADEITLARPVDQNNAK